jgi:transcription termination/antitermination protein NusA
VGVRGTRIKNIVDELGGERIDIVRWNESLQVLIPNALQPAEIDEVMLCQLLGRAIVLVREDQLSLAIGRRGQNVRLASKLVGWDIEIMTSEELDELIEKAVAAFTKIEGVEPELAERLVEQGILSYDDLSVMEISDLVNTIEGLTEEQAVEIVGQAEILAEEQAEDLPRRKGARVAAPAPETASETPPADGTDPRAARGMKTTLDDLFGSEGVSEDGMIEEVREEGVGEDGLTGEVATEEIAEGSDGENGFDQLRDMALAAEEGGYPAEGHEVTSPPSNADQDETNRIVTEAVESGAGPVPINVHEAGGGPNVPPLPPTEPFSTDEVEVREPEMHQP